MRVAIIALGSRGDVQPHVALGVGLRRAGHSVRVVTSSDFGDLVRAHELEFCDTGVSTEAIANEMHDLLEAGNFLKIMTAMGVSAERVAVQAATNGLAACKESDVILSGLGGLFVGHALAEKLGVPFVQAYLYPFSPTREFPGVLTPVPQTPLTSWANAPSHRATRQMLWQTTRSADATVRVKVLGLKPSAFWGPFGELAGEDQLSLYGYSEHVIPVPHDWPPQNHVTGYWFLEPSLEWRPPTELVAFLEAGPPPVYVGFGSMGSKNPEATADLVLESLRRTGQRGVLSSGWGGLTKNDLPDSVCMIGSIPHAWLFSRMTAIVHHGGAGTTAAALSAGVPSIVTPVMGDQAFWAGCVSGLGVGPKAVPRRKLTVERLSRAIEAAVSDSAMRARSANLGEQIRAEDGITKAVDLIERRFETAR
ncbi:MAG: glycosyltransferase family 1 protein [Coriobacteriia bacterium]|nr:glycosyltransferase family 1 protein [Coriobacteriia bacterium]